MLEAAVFAPELRLELIEGQILEARPTSDRQARIVTALRDLFEDRAGQRATVSTRPPIIVSDRSVLHPDVVALITPRADASQTAHHAAADVTIAVEVADATLAFDLEGKVQLYAAGGIPEVWVVDVNERRYVSIARRVRSGTGTPSLPRGAIA
jgi:Uma2 family endonuclease